MGGPNGDRYGFSRRLDYRDRFSGKSVLQYGKFRQFARMAVLGRLRCSGRGFCRPVTPRWMHAATVTDVHGRKAGRAIEKRAEIFNSRFVNALPR